MKFYCSTSVPDFASRFGGAATVLFEAIMAIGRPEFRPLFAERGLFLSCHLVYSWLGRGGQVDPFNLLTFSANDLPGLRLKV
jgi:hypothetical protein